MLNILPTHLADWQSTSLNFDEVVVEFAPMSAVSAIVTARGNADASESFRSTELSPQVFLWGYARSSKAPAVSGKLNR
ncbi:MAG: hypothetical protein EOP06_22895 [Proteobacteria bacterium]|nr:MAG: hypothetical protein EOP06_22895 [Pseudomonadota bacterium]